MAADDQIFTGDVGLHAIFQAQVKSVLDRTEIDEESRQAILVAMNCPCCGAGGMNYTVPLTRKNKGRAI
jgi:hypothetical protein